MESLLVQVFATLLTLSQVLIQPTQVKTSFDPSRDQGEVVSVLRQGCMHMRRAFEIEDLNLDDLVATAMDDPDARSATFRGVRFTDLHEAYKALCKGAANKLPVDLAAVIEFYNRALTELPDHTRLRDLKLPATTMVLDRNGEKFAEVYEPANRRIPVRLTAVAPILPEAFIASEDKRFREHKGVDERGLIRAFIANMAAGEGQGGMQGGSTITQQVAKNLLVGRENSYVRKMREMVVAARMETVLSKDAILELYLNAIYLGRGAWGVQMAAQTYFGKDASAVNAGEAALLAGLAKGPSYYSPDRYPERSRERTAYVLNRMREDDVISAGQMDQAMAQPPHLILRDTNRRMSGYHVVDHIRREARRVADIMLLSDDAYVIRSTLDARIQKAAEAALQDGLADYERGMGRARFESAEMNVRDRVDALLRTPAGDLPPWQQALTSARLPLYDVHWPAAVVLDKADTRQKPGNLWVGLADGRIVPLQVPGEARRKLKPYDVVYVRLATTKKNETTAELRIRPKVQGAVVVIDNATGGILAMTGSFSYPLSQLNRVTQSWRQPGSAFKPLTYLTALGKGLQPTTLISDSPLTLPPIGSRKHARAGDWWSPHNYDNKSGSTITLRQALERSRNVPTAQLMARGIAATPEAGLKEICNLALELQLYGKCVHFYPFVLGAQPVRPLDLARFYATVANEGVLPDTHMIEKISDPSGERFDYEPPQGKRIASADAAAFYQLKSILEGVVLRGTAARLSAWAPYLAGKTGTTDDETDAWFIGFSNEATVAVWVGYDNAKGRQTLGKGRTGGNVAVPIFAPIMEAVWKEFPQTALAPPRDAASQLAVASNTEGKQGRESRREPKRSSKGFEIVEYLRTDAKGHVSDKRYALTADRSSSHVVRRSRPRDIDQDGYASARAYGPERAQERSWNWFGGGGGWGSQGPFGGPSPSARPSSSPSQNAFGQDGGFGGGQGRSSPRSRPSTFGQDDGFGGGRGVSRPAPSTFGQGGFWR
ncbi:MAG: transglycosylase domain-containing protein [Xanthobacteraceae bacterium]|nr:transglycosylase domain-containing protein [Xanthobacteraceae bacterium]